MDFAIELERIGLKTDGRKVAAVQLEDPEDPEDWDVEELEAINAFCLRKGRPLFQHRGQSKAAQVQQWR